MLTRLEHPLTFALKNIEALLNIQIKMAKDV